MVTTVNLVVSDPAAICQPNTIDLTDPAITAGSAPTGMAFTYFVDNPAMTPVGTPAAVGDSSYTYTIVASTVTIPACTDTATVNVTVHPKPILNITDPAAVCEPTTVDVTAPAITAGSTLFGATLSYFEDVLLIFLSDCLEEVRDRRRKD